VGKKADASVCEWQIQGPNARADQVDDDDNDDVAKDGGSIV
jgi:hypothetical protein